MKTVLISHGFEVMIAHAPPPILVFWHEHLFCFGIVLPAGCAALQSPHADGRILDIPTRLYGVSPVLGQLKQAGLIKPARAGWRN